MAIWSNIHQKHFYLAEEAPISNSPMQEVLKYNVNLDVGEEVLGGTYRYEDEFDEHTKDILQEAAPTQSAILKDSVSDAIRHKEWGGSRHAYARRHCPSNLGYISVIT